jgi:hypothetical protein
MRKKLTQNKDSLWDKPDCVRTNMNINYMIIQAREQVNDAIQNLMTKDSKLSHLHIDKLSKRIEIEQRANASTDDDSISDDSGEDGAIPAEELKKKEKVVPYVNQVSIG